MRRRRGAFRRPARYAPPPSYFRTKPAQRNADFMRLGAASTTDLSRNCSITTWDSPRDAVEAAISLGAGAWYGDSSFSGEERWQVREGAAGGRLDLVPRAEELMAKLSLDVESSRRVRRHGMAGSWPDVARALAGDPDSMWRTEEDRSEAAPIRIVYDRGALGRVPAHLLVDRGITVLALVMAAAARRPVELWAASGLGDADGSNSHLQLMRVSTHPLDLAAACFATGSVGLMRNACFGLATWAANGGRGSDHGCWSTSWGPYDEYARNVREAFDDEGSRLFVVPRCNDERTDTLLMDPVGFIQRAIDSDFGSREEDE